MGIFNCINWESGNLTDLISAIITFFGMVLTYITIRQVKKQNVQIENQIEISKKAIQIAQEANEIAGHIAVDARLMEYTIYLLQEGRTISNQINNVNLVTSLIDVNLSGDIKSNTLSKVLTDIILYEQFVNSIKDKFDKLDVNKITDTFRTFLQPMLLDRLKKCDKVNFNYNNSSYNSAANANIERALNEQLKSVKSFLQLNTDPNTTDNITIDFN